MTVRDLKKKNDLHKRNLCFILDIWVSMTQIVSKSRGGGKMAFRQIQVRKQNHSWGIPVTKWWEMLRQVFKTQGIVQKKVVTQKPSSKKNMTMKIFDIIIKHKEKMFFTFATGHFESSEVEVMIYLNIYGRSLIRCPTYIQINLLKLNSSHQCLLSSLCQSLIYHDSSPT